MILVIDSGGTKLEWRLIREDGGIQQGRSAGFNIVVSDFEQLSESLSDLKAQLEDEVKRIHFYVAGLSSKQHKLQVTESVTNRFPSAEIHVDNDLLAVARALCDDQEGIACILGTGSNSCYYDGIGIVENIPPLGYVLGDEGSGVDIGKRLLRHFTRGMLPDTLSCSFRKRYNLDVDKIITSVYRQKMPNKFLGQFSKFAFDHQREPVINDLIRASFNDFFENVLFHYPGIKAFPVHFSGSIAFYFGNILRQVGKEHSVNIQKVVESPIAGLTLFHEKELHLLKKQ